MWAGRANTGRPDPENEEVPSRFVGALFLRSSPAPRKEGALGKKF
jgi:hypothetical protein